MKVAWLLLATAASLPATAFHVIVAGLGGEADYEQRFAAWAKTADLTLRGSGEARVETLTGAAATRAAVRAVLARLAGESRAGDSLVLMLIGHGGMDGSDYKFNLPGPDLTAGELSGLLNKVQGAQLVVNMTSASGGSLAALKRANRAVITATKSGTERNATVFARYWVEALRDPSSDTDKNEIVSALEAFRYAERKTGAFYESQKRLATEHALLEDTGQGEGVRTPSPENGRGLMAAQFRLLRLGAAQAAAKDPAKQKLMTRREELEQAIDRLKYQKAALPVEDYRKQLAALLLELARTQAEIDK